MSTYFPTREKALQDRKWVVIDAAGKPLGRVATKIASVLRGKDKPTFTPHVDTGDFVVVVNAAKVALTGNKAQTKMYYHHTTYVGGIKEIAAGDLLKKSPEKLFHRAVKGMLPRGPLGFHLITKMKVYDGAEHPHKSQNPTPIEIDG